MGFVAVVDYGMGNLDSVRRAFEVLGATAVVTSDPADLADADRIVLPGVGAFGVAMDHLRERGLEAALADAVVVGGAPFLGICLGMQLMAATGTEHGHHTGLGWIPGSVTRLVPTPADPRVPHVGWNEVHRCDTTSGHPLLSGIDDDSDFYFVHSYRFECDDEASAVARTPYAGGFTSVVQASATAFGVQFHPEKSQRAGQALLRNFLSIG